MDGTFKGNAEAILDEAYALACTRLEELGIKYDSMTDNVIFFSDTDAKKTYVFRMELDECEEYEGD